jgi:hypothetical protein
MHVLVSSMFSDISNQVQVIKLLGYNDNAYMYRTRRYIAIWAYVVCMGYRSYRKSGAIIVLTTVPDL